jgi:hypothetical protein
MASEFEEGFGMGAAAIARAMSGNYAGYKEIRDEAFARMANLKDQSSLKSIYASGRTAGQIAYEEDCNRRPHYDGGEMRPRWADLDEVAKSSWEKNPTPRDWSK